MIALNITDLLICCFSIANVFYFKYFEHGGRTKATCENDSFLTNDFNFLIGIALMCLTLFSCFITLMLSATRTLALVKPLYIIRRQFVYIAFGIFTFFLLIIVATKCTIVFSMKYIGCEIVYDDKIKIMAIVIGWVELSIVFIIVILVGILTGISVKTLRNPNEVLRGRAANSANSRKAAMMILILSIIFVICNGAWSIIWAILTDILPNDGPSDESSRTLIAQIINYFWVAVNSSANPIVYMTRNSALNDYTKTPLTRLMRFIMASIQTISRIVSRLME